MLHQNKHSSNFRISPKRKVSLYIKDSNDYVYLFIQILPYFVVFFDFLESLDFLFLALLVLVANFQLSGKISIPGIKTHKKKQEGKVYFTLPYQLPALVLLYNYWSYLTQD